MKYTETARRLRMALEHADMKPQELSDLSGVNKSSISQYVNGSHKPSNVSAGRMADVLNVNPLWLMGFDCPMKDDTSKRTDTHLALSTVEKDIVTHYRAADPTTQGIVRTILKVEDKEEEKGISVS